jgi:hypothetical protein
MADKVKLTEDMELPPGIVLTPGYEVPERPANVGGFGDRRIVVHEDNAARQAFAAKFYTEEVADHPIASTYEGAGRGAAKREDDGAAARDHAKASGAAKA